MKYLVWRLGKFQPPEQAEFRCGYGTKDYIHTVRYIIQKTEKYNAALCLSFVDYEKAFDLIEIQNVEIEEKVFNQCVLTSTGQVE